jgi:hypothetical protein
VTRTTFSQKKKKKKGKKRKNVPRATKSILLRNVQSQTGASKIFITQKEILVRTVFPFWRERCGTLRVSASRVGVGFKLSVDIRMNRMPCFAENKSEFGRLYINP